MSVELLIAQDGRTVMYCNTSDTAFGPVFPDAEDAVEFMEWLKTAESPRQAYLAQRIDASGDPRNFQPYELERLWVRFLTERRPVAA